MLLVALIMGHWLVDSVLVLVEQVFLLQNFE